MSDKIRIECEEDGFWLHVDTEFGESTHMLKIEDPEALYDHVKAAIGPWLYEREQARAEFLRDAAIASEGGYDASDPKHPDFHSVHADIWDAREGK